MSTPLGYLDRNVNTDTVTTVLIVLQSGDYKKNHKVSVKGNVCGFSLIESAVEELKDNIEFSAGCFGDDVIYLYKDGGSLEVAISDYDTRLEDLIVSVSIIKQVNK